MAALGTYFFEKGVAIPVPRVEEPDPFALCLGPGITVSEGSEQRESNDGQDQEESSGGLVDNGLVLGADAKGSSSHKVEKLTERDDGKIEGWEIVMEEELTAHEEEREVVQCPSQDGSTELIVESLEGGIGIIIAAALPSQDGNGLEDNPDDDGNRRGPPDNGIANQVDLRVVLAPKVDAAS